MLDHLSFPLQAPHLLDLLGGSPISTPATAPLATPFGGGETLLDLLDLDVQQPTPLSRVLGGEMTMGRDFWTYSVLLHLLYQVSDIIVAYMHLVGFYAPYNNTPYRGEAHRLSPLVCDINAYYSQEKLPKIFP